MVTATNVILAGLAILVGSIAIPRLLRRNGSNIIPQVEAMEPPIQTPSPQESALAQIAGAQQQISATLAAAGSQNVPVVEIVGGRVRQTAARRRGIVSRGPSPLRTGISFADIGGQKIPVGVTSRATPTDIAAVGGIRQLQANQAFFDSFQAQIQGLRAFSQQLSSLQTQLESV